VSPRQRLRSGLGVSRRRLAIALAVTVLTVAVALALEYGGLAAIGAEASAVAVTLLDRWGYPALLGVFVLEGFMLLYMAPSESLVPAAIVAFGDRPGTLAAILSIAVVGATLGQVALFVLVRRAGREYVLERGWFGVSEPQLARFDAWFEKWGPIAVPVTNAMLFVRGMITVPAGLSDMRLRTFAVLSAIGTLCFEAALLALTLGVLSAL
jgi:membrane protein DedA with SNARE-associated domain